MNLLTISHELACLALLYTVFCRAVRCDHTTYAAVRIAFQALGTVASLGIVAPLMWPRVPSWWGVLLLLSIVLVQTVTARYWSDGPPTQFRHSHH